MRRNEPTWIQSEDWKTYKIDLHCRIPLALKFRAVSAVNEFDARHIHSNGNEPEDSNPDEDEYPSGDVPLVASASLGESSCAVQAGHRQGLLAIYAAISPCWMSFAPLLAWTQVAVKAPAFHAVVRGAVAVLEMKSCWYVIVSNSPKRD